MSEPTEFDFALIKMGDGASPEVFTVICGLQDVTINTTANTQDRATYDCAKPAKPGIRKVRVNYVQQDITGSGLSNSDTVADMQAALGRPKNFEIEGYQDDGTDTGLLLGTFAGPYKMTATNLNLARNNGTGEITLASDGVWTWTPAVDGGGDA